MRSAPLIALSGVIAGMGLDTASVTRDLGNGAERLDDVDNAIEYSDLGRAFARAVDATCCPHLGLEVGRRAGLDVLGVIGQASASAVDLGSALRFIARYLHLHDRAAFLSLRQWGDRAALGYVVHLPDVPGVEIIDDTVLAIIQESLRLLAGQAWRASEARLCRARPEDVSPYQDAFGTSLCFGSRYAELVFPARDLERPLASADPRAFAEVTAELDAMVRLTSTGCAERVRRLLRRLLMVDEMPRLAHLIQVARLLGLHPRTLNRRLRDEGTSFKGLIAETRLDIARQLLRNSQLTIIEIAATLGYGDPTAFCRAFRCAVGVSPSVWRAEHSPD